MGKAASASLRLLMVASGPPEGKEPPGPVMEAQTRLLAFVYQFKDRVEYGYDYFYKTRTFEQVAKDLPITDDEGCRFANYMKDFAALVRVDLEVATTRDVGPNLACG